MKRIIILPIVVLIACFVFPGCEKPEETVTETLNITLEKNQAYHYNLPAGENEGAFEITTQASHYSISRIDNGSFVYFYTPQQGYTGTDRVVLENEQDQRKGKGKCGKGNEDAGRKIIINFTIRDFESK